MRVTSLLNQIADETAGSAMDARALPYVSAFVEGSGVISSGVVTIEEASDASYVGTWSEITTVTASDLTGGVQKAIHLQPASYGFIRARISTAIGGGGSVSVYLHAGGA